MSTTRRLATLTLAATAALGLAACSSTIEAKGVPSQQEQSQPAEPPVQEAGDTDAAEPTETEPVETEPASTGDEDLPVPGDGIPGDAGLCQAVVGWFGYAGLSLIAVDEDGNINPDDIVPLLEAMRDAPQDHQDASSDLLDSAADVSDATDQVIGQIRSGANALDAFSSLETPVTAFGESCVAHGVQV